LNLKILHLNTYSSGGAAIAAIRLHEALLEYGVDSKMLFLRGNKKIDQGFFYKEVRKEKPFQVFFRLLNKFYKRKIKNILLHQKRGKKEPIPNWSSKIEIFTSPVTNFHVENHHLIKDADIIHLHWIGDFVNIQSFFKKVRKPIFWYFHDMNPIMGGLHYSGDLQKIKNSTLMDQEEEYNRIKDHSIKHVKELYVQCDSEWLTAETLKLKRFQSTVSVQTIHYSLDFDVFYPLSKKNAKSILGLPLDKKIILFGAENILIKRKGLDLLLGAINSLTNKNEVFLTTFGGGDLPEFKDNFSSIKTFGKVQSAEIQRIIFSAADIFIIPSRQEAFGQTALEAMACGTPVIGFRTGGIPDIISHGINGLLIDQINSEKLTEGIEKLVQDNQFLAKLTRSARPSVLEKFSRNRQVKSFLVLYEMALNGTGVRREKSIAGYISKRLHF